jgi:hypothetical protein
MISASTTLRSLAVALACGAAWTAACTRLTIVPQLVCRDDAGVIESCCYDQNDNPYACCLNEAGNPCDAGVEAAADAPEDSTAEGDSSVPADGSAEGEGGTPSDGAGAD